MDEESLRCGRCATLMPDETLSYCPACGIIFSEVPPTTSYLTMESRFIELNRRRRLIHFSIASFLVFLFGILILSSSFELHRRGMLQQIKEKRNLSFFIQQDPNYPQIAPFEVMAAIPIGVQAYKDHFGIEIENWTIHQKTLPDSFEKLVSDNPGLSQQGLFWATAVREYFFPDWIKAPYSNLNVVITNRPIRATPDSEKVLETSHLGDNKLISGLGDPSLVIISLHRLATEYSHFNSNQKSRFIGEYLLAHELGHAFLGLKDYVVDSPEENLRAPASSAISQECLMHTDAGGGSQAWKAIELKPLGRLSKCDQYAYILQSHKLRNQAIRSFKEGKKEMAISSLREAISIYENQAGIDGANKVYPHLWRRELKLISCFFSSWTL